MSLTWRARPAGDAFRNGNVVHLFVIYSLTLNGNPMGPIKAPSVPSAQPQEGWSPSSSRGKKLLKVEPTSLLPPQATLTIHCGSLNF